MKALLLSAGYGTRLKPITDNIPKCLVKIAEKPLIDYWLELILLYKDVDILINTHYLSNLVNDHISRSKYADKITLRFEPKLLGTAGTLMSNLDFINDETLLLAHADNLSIFNLEDFIHAHNHRPDGCLMTMMLFKSDDPSSCGIVKLDKKGVVTDFFEKVPFPPSNLANGAVYLLDPSILNKIKLIEKCSDFSTHVIPLFVNKIYTYLNTNYHRDIGSIKNLEIANRDFKGKSSYYC